MAKLDLSMTPDQLEAYLRDQRTVRVATVDEQGVPHVVPLWFVWIDDRMFLNSTRGNVTVGNLLAGRPASAVVDDGDAYDELRGVVVAGRASEADGDPRVPDAERAWSDKYMGGNELPYRRWKGRLWLRLDPEHVTSWDFRKIPEARARRDAERGAEGR